MKGFKGFNADLTCRGYQYRLGEVHEYTGNLYLGSSGFHFCSNLEDVFTYYNSTGTNIFAEVEAVGDVKETSHDSKKATNKLKVVRIIPQEEIENFIKNLERKKLEKDVYGLDVLRELQKNYQIIVGGSCALYLYGLPLDRVNSLKTPDFDIVMPFYQKIHTSTLSGEGENTIDEIEEFDGKSSGNDFDRTFLLNTCDDRFFKLDVKVDPKASYNIVTHNGHKYKVAELLDIIEAKCRYANKGNNKHKEDLYKLLGFDKKILEKNTSQNISTDLDEFFPF